MKNEHAAHVKVAGSSGEHVATYSVAKWFLEELAKAGTRL